VKPAARRQIAAHFIEQFSLSQRRACRLVGLQPCIYRYQSRRGSDGLVRERLKRLAREHPRWGYRFLGVLLRREGHKINHKRVLRLYREEGLKLRPKKRRKVVSMQRERPPATTGINQRWSMDFVSDTLSCGRRFRALSVIDCHSRECLALEVDTSLTGERVVRVLERLKETRGLPAVIQTDNGPEFTGHALDAWAYRNRVKLFFIEPGKPVQNAHIESFNGKLRNECLNLEWFTSLREAQEIIESWRTEYNGFRPHSSLNNLPPLKWLQKQAEKAENLYSEM
jgi:putative transposase